MAKVTIVEVTEHGGWGNREFLDLFVNGEWIGRGGNADHTSLLQSLAERLGAQVSVEQVDRHEEE